jgi:hypothetical protein
MIDGLMDGYISRDHTQPVHMLDIGCFIGKDFVKFLKGRVDIRLYGLDIADAGLRQENFDMIIGNASHIPFPDRFFDLTLSIGVLEHIVPIEKLSRAISEINRTSKSHVSIMPSNGTLIEPHMARFFWHLQDGNRHARPGSKQFDHLIYMSDEAWTSFEGFKNAKTKRYWHIPFLINNLVVYKRDME